MTVVNVHEAQTHLSRLLDAAVAGEEVIIAEDRKPGAAKGKGKFTEAFFEPLPEEELKVWE